MPDSATHSAEVFAVLDDFIAKAREALGANLRSAILFGSAAEDRLRATSDVNLILVLERFDAAAIDPLREPYRLAHATIQLRTMWLLASEIPAAAEAFAVKWSDILARHRILYGEDPFATLVIPRDATLRRLRQVLLNLELRLRHDYALVSLREEQVALVIADAAGPLRASAATLLALQGHSGIHPKEALQQVVAAWNDARLTSVLAQISDAREDGQLPPGAALPALIDVIALTARLLTDVTSVEASA